MSGCRIARIFSGLVLYASTASLHAFASQLYNVCDCLDVHILCDLPHAMATACECHGSWVDGTQVIIASPTMEYVVSFSYC